MQRRTYLKASSTAAAALALAGCLGGDGGSGGDGNGGTGTGHDDGHDHGGTETETDGSGEEQETIVIGSDIPYRPFEYYTTDDELVGFDVEIADAVFAGQLGYEYEFQETAFDGIIQSLNNGNFRVIMSAMTITEDRAEQVDFSDPYFTAYQTVIVLQNSDIQSKEDLRGVTVGVQKGTTGAGAADELKAEFDDDLEIQRYDQIPDAFQALRNGQVDAVINDNTVNAEFVNENPDTVRFLEGEGVAEGENAPDYLTLTVEEYGIAFRKGDELREEVNQALGTIRDDGTYDEIYNEYFAG